MRKKFPTPLERIAKMSDDERQQWVISMIEEAIKEVGEDMAPFYLLGVFEATLGVNVRLSDYLYR